MFATAKWGRGELSGLVNMEISVIDGEYQDTITALIEGTKT